MFYRSSRLISQTFLRPEYFYGRPFFRPSRNIDYPLPSTSAVLFVQHWLFPSPYAITVQQQYFCTSRQETPLDGNIASSLFENNWLSWQILSDDKIQISLLILRQGAFTMSNLPLSYDRIHLNIFKSIFLCGIFLTVEELSLANTGCFWEPLLVRHSSFPSSF